jgi:hypothetical protein
MLAKTIKMLSVALVIGMVLAGCGGGGSESQNSSAPLSKAELIKQGDVICGAADKKQEAGLQAYLKAHPGGPSNSAEQEKVILAVAIPPIQAEAEELGELEAPGADADKVTAIVEGIEAAVKKGEADPGSVSTAGEGPFAAVDKLAREYGFKVCSQAL